MAGASASSGELERAMKDGNSRGPLTGVPGLAWESSLMMMDNCGLEEKKKSIEIMTLNQITVEAIPKFLLSIWEDEKH